jgi:cbb3-type cytochrome oxidase cytochrome c subunit
MGGPDLTAVSQRQSSEYIARYIRNPRAANPQARMPAFPELTWRERRAIVAYLTQ